MERMRVSAARRRAQKVSVLTAVSCLSSFNRAPSWPGHNTSKYFTETFPRYTRDEAPPLEGLNVLLLRFFLLIRTRLRASTVNVESRGTIHETILWPITEIRGI